MANDSTAAGYLTPADDALTDNALADALQGAVVGITGLPGPLVRPRWQPEPPQQPAFDVNWCAFGLVRYTADVNPYIAVDGTGAGLIAVERDLELYVLHSFYGPDCDRYCGRLRAGLELDQNRATLRAAGIVVKEVQESVILPALLKEKWVQRIDATVIYRTRPSYTYQVRRILQGQLGIDNESWVTPITVQQP